MDIISSLLGFLARMAIVVPTSRHAAFDYVPQSIFRVQKLEREHVGSMEYGSASNTRILKRIRKRSPSGPRGEGAQS